METVATNYSGHVHETTGKTAHRVASVLRWTYGLVSITAGTDEFVHILTDWDKYLTPVITDILPFTPHTFMNIVGVIEIAAGIIVLVKPKIGSLIVGFWLISIVINLLLSGQYYDIAVRDTVMAIGAFSLYMLLDQKHNGHKEGI